MFSDVNSTEEFFLLIIKYPQFQSTHILSSMAGNHPSSAVFFSGCRRWLLFAIILLFQFQLSQSQQSYVNNKQLQCDQNYTTTLGYVCPNNTRNVSGAATSLSSCASYVTFRSTPVYNSPVTIGYLLDADPSDIARLNNISDVGTIPANTLIVVPVNCSCSSAPGGPYYQHKASYVLKFTGETYLIVANNTYQGLTTCQSMIGQNSYNYRNLLVDMKVNIPLRCACPSPNQTVNGIKYLLTYLIIPGDTINDIAGKFVSGGANNQSIFDANQISFDGVIFPFTPLLVPLKTEFTKIDLTASPPPPPSPPVLPTSPVTDDDNNSSRKWLFVGVGIGAGLLLLASMSGFLVWFFRRRSLKEGKQTTPLVPNRYGDYHKPIEPANNQSSSWSVSSEGVRYAIGSLAHYKFEELQQATGFFSESNRIRGSVYRGSFKGDNAAVKIMKGDVSTEINILKQINHSNIIRLSGYCVHQGNTYLVYEYAEQGSVSDLLHDSSSMRKDELRNSTVVGWNQRVQIAYDVADALNYLHNYTNPPCIHKNLSSNNVLLDGNLRAKIANFGLARTLMENDRDRGMQLTRHVVGTHGCMAPEYIENGLITPKMDVFAFGVLVLELLSGREAVHKDKEDELLYVKIIEVLGGENVRKKLREFMDPCLRDEYPLDLAYSMAQLARCCVVDDLNSRPNIAEVFMTLSKIHSSSLDPSDEDYSRSMSHGR